jgi:phosphoketolase
MDLLIDDIINVELESYRQRKKIEEQQKIEQQKRDQEQRRKEQKQEKQIPHKMTEKELALNKYLDIIAHNRLFSMADANDLPETLNLGDIRKQLMDIYMKNPSKLIIVNADSPEEEELQKIFIVQESPSLKSSSESSSSQEPVGLKQALSQRESDLRRATLSRRPNEYINEIIPILKEKMRNYL